MLSMGRINHSCTPKMGGVLYSYRMIISLKENCIREATKSDAGPQAILSYPYWYLTDKESKVFSVQSSSCV